MVLETIDLSKNYGSLKAVDGINLNIPKGSVFGILGPNGSGKTTTLAMILDVVRISKGSYKWFGESPSKNHRARIGAILETPIFYPYLSAVKNLEIVAKIKQVPNDRIVPVLKQVDLFERAHDDFKTYSLGMKQRLSIASALLCDPEVMILDEPTNGLDPQGIASIRDLIINIAKEGKTIILASHLLDEVQKVCSDFAVLKKGKLIYSGKVEDVSKGEETIHIGAEGLQSSMLASCEMVASQNLNLQGIFEVKLQNGFTASDINNYLFEKGITASHLVTQKRSLEKQFLEILADTE